MASSDLRYVSGDLHHLAEMSLVLLGCRNSGKSSAGNTILGREEFPDVQESAQCVKRQGEVARRKVTVVDAPGWCRDTPVAESNELLKEEIVCSVSQCPPGPRAVLAVVNGNRMFTEKDGEILAGYLNLLGDKVWSHTIVLFTFGDSLGDTTIEKHVESEGEALQWLLEKCGNRYQVFNNKTDDDSQVMELLEKIEKMVEGNRSCQLEMDVKILPKVEESRREEEQKSNERRMKGMKYSPYFMNGCVYLFKFLQVFWFSSELELLPWWSITRSPRFRVGFPWVLRFPPTSQNHAEDFREASGTEKGTQSTSDLHAHAGHASADTEQFTPELVENCPKDKNRDEYRFLCPHAGQFMCKLTNLVFEMEGKGEVLYRIVSWDSRLLDRLDQTEPAGPLYSIHCPEGSIRYLHLPHCETRTDVVKLSVAHVTGGNVEIIQPLNVTDTHVIIHVQGLSLFGLLKSLLFQTYPIRAQVLLFYKTITGKRRMSKLHIHLLPANVPVEEVQKQHMCNTYIETSSKCQLTPGRNYSPRCKTTDCDYVPQPEEEIFDCDYGPNYHPTFEVVFKTEVDEVTLNLLDEKDQEVWRPRLVMLTGTEATSTKMDRTGADFVDKHRETLIQRVSSVMAIADCLKSKNMITDEMYSNISVESSSYKQMRLLYKSLDSGGRAVKAEFYKILKEKDPYIVDDLESGLRLA